MVARKSRKAPAPASRTVPDPTPVDAGAEAEAGPGVAPKRRRTARRAAAGSRRIPTGEPGRDQAIDATSPPHEGDLPGELGPPAGDSSRVR